MNKIKKILVVYSEIFFSDSLLIGGIVAAATFIDFNTGIAGLLAVFSAYIFSKLTFSPRIGFEPFYYYNPLLVGLSIGVLFKISFLTLILIFAAGILAFVLTVVLNFLLKKYTGLPVLSIPFVIVSSFVYLATIRSSNLFSNYLVYQKPAIFFNIPDWCAGYFLSLGAIFFSKNVIVGIMISVGLFLFSRIAFFLSIIGYYTGALITGGFNSALSSTYMNLNYFNYILIAIAIGSIYLIPSFKSYIIAVFAVVISYIILGASEVFFQSYGIPVFTLPFNIIVLSFIFYSDITNSKLKTYTFLKNPETNLDFYINYTKRFGVDIPAISLPFTGEWKITQGFADEITHKGIWKYGVDFVLVDENDAQFEGAPNSLKNYFAYAKPVLSPLSGTVVAIENSIEDNEIGSINREQNWGNYVVVYDTRGIYIKICHLKKGSVVTEKGTYVETGQKIAQCGNSGYAPFPHIHIQVQGGAMDSAPTMEFQFEQLICGGRFYDKLSPLKGQALLPIHSTIKKKKIFELLLGDSFQYLFNINRNDNNILETKEKIRVVMDEVDGMTYLENGGSRLYFSVYKNMFRFYKYRGGKQNILRYIYLAMPSLPLCDDKIEWDDFLPLGISLKFLSKNIILLFQSVYPDVCRNQIKLWYSGAGGIESHNVTTFMNKTIIKTNSSVVLDREKFINSVQIKQGDTVVDIKRQSLFA